MRDFYNSNVVFHTISSTGNITYSRSYLYFEIVVEEDENLEDEGFTIPKDTPPIVLSVSITGQSYEV
jgi:hypothetical protein